MINVYKIGLHYYKDKDKNSGLFEYNMICNELKDIQTDKNIILVINGKLKDEDEKCKIINSLKNYDLRIFIMSDEIAMINNMDIINECDIILHQSTNNIIPEIRIKQYYGYIPELFYKAVKNKFYSVLVDKKDKIYFGGNDTGRKDKFDQYKLYEENDLIEKRIKTENIDQRIDYFDYLNELSKCKYSLIICREFYTKVNWITSRYFESLAVNTMPILDKDYDVNNYLQYTLSKCSDYSMLKNIEYDESIMLKMQQKAERDSNKFYELINKLIGGKI